MARRKLSRHRPNRVLIWLLAGMVGWGVYLHAGVILAGGAGWCVLAVAKRLPWL